MFQAMLPANGEEIVLSSKCENSDFSAIKEHLKFNFIPSKISVVKISNILYFHLQWMLLCKRKLEEINAGAIL